MLILEPGGDMPGFILMLGSCAPPAAPSLCLARPRNSAHRVSLSLGPMQSPHAPLVATHRGTQLPTQIRCFQNKSLAPGGHPLLTRH